MCDRLVVGVNSDSDLLKTKGMCESVVEVDAWQAVSSLEYEKWRDSAMSKKDFFNNNIAVLRVFNDIW